MADENVIRVRLVTPDKTFLNGTARAVTLPARSGVMQVLYGHTPVLTELGVGDVALEGGDIGEQKFFVVWGFAEVLPSRVTILAERVLSREEIDVEDAKKQLERGQQMWKEAGDDSVRYEEAHRVIRQAEELIAAAGRSGKSA